MRLDVKTNADEVQREVEAFIDEVRVNAFRVAASRLRDMAQTVGLRKIAELYQIGPRTMERFVGVSLDQTSLGFEASIFARGKGFPLYVFNPKQTARGVQVTVKGKRHLFPHAFIARMPNGGVGVFARGAYGGKGIRKPSGESIGRFVLGRSRLPINQLYTLSPPDALANPEVTAVMQSRVEEKAGEVIKGAIRFAKRG